jgi:hypothetical protein
MIEGRMNDPLSGPSLHHFSRAIICGGQGVQLPMDSVVKVVERQAGARDIAT